MISSRFLTRSAACAILIAGFAAATPANAGRCGYSFPVDAPTTLSKVARACNVSFGALREANPGVDPSNVRPGQHLAVPDEVEYGQVNAPIAASSDGDTVDTDYSDTGSNHPYIVSRPINSYRTYYDDEAPVRRVNASNNSLATPYYLQGGSSDIQPRHSFEDSRLSYQKLAADRIRTAGIAVNRGPIDKGIGNFAKPSQFTTISAPSVPVMECAVVQRQANGKIQQVREFKPIAPGRETPLHCIAMNADAPVRAPTDIVVTRGTHPSLKKIATAHSGVLKGFVTAVDTSCVAIQTRDGLTTTVRTTQDARNLLEKDATLWVTKSNVTSGCGDLVMSHAVYAERWPAQ